ncbi:MAG: hypothetical protein Q9188_002232 [Gyalolechia gomerana]
MDDFYGDTPTTLREAAMRTSFKARVSVTAHGRVTQLVLDYGSIQTMHPAVTIMRRSQASDIMFQQAMTNDYKLLCNRSLHLEDYEINIYEAAFSKLMADVDTHIGAIHIYVEEILGLRAVSQPLKLRALTNAVQVRTLISNLSSTTQLRGIVNLSEQPNCHATQMDTSPYEFQTNTHASSTSNDPKLNDLLSAYHDAIANFRMTAADTTVQLNFARILCDKAEQCFNCMREVNAGDMRLNDFYESYLEAKRAIEMGEQAPHNAFQINRT